MRSPDDSVQPFSAAPLLLSSATLTAIQPIAYPAGALLFRAGDPDDVLLIILSGQLALFGEHDALDAPPVFVGGADMIFGDMAVLSRDTVAHRFSGRALTDLHVLAVQRDQVDALLHREPLVAYHLMRIAGIKLHHGHEMAMRAQEAKNAQLEHAYAALRAAQAQLVEHARMQHELQLARELQAEMLPDALPQVPGIDLGARIVPAREVSGDFYDIFMVNDDSLGVLIGDVCDKGMPAALYMAQARSLLRAATGLPEPPAEVLRLVNRLLREMNRGTMFVTCILVRLHLPTRMLEVARAGHEHPLLYGGDGAPRPLPQAIGQPLGVVADPVIDRQTRVLAPDETLLLYTDGVTEATDARAAFFGGERLDSTVRAASGATAQELCDHIVQQVAAFQGTARQADDITLVALRAT